MNVSDKSVTAAGKLYEEVQRLRAEVASLKEENAALKKNRRDKFYEAIDWRNEVNTLTQRLQEAKEYGEVLATLAKNVVAHRIEMGASMTVPAWADLQSALRLSKPWDKN
jgi:predicted RNase H-like nuclease (RuvC/YqgF family)